MKFYKIDDQIIISDKERRITNLMKCQEKLCNYFLEKSNYPTI